MERMHSRLKLTGFWESFHGEPGLLLQIQWKNERFPFAQYTFPPTLPFEDDDSFYSSLHRIPYDSRLPPSELDLSRFFSTSGFSAQCSLYLAPKIASFISDISSSLRRLSPHSLSISAELNTLDMNFVNEIYAPTEPLIPSRQDPYHHSQGVPLRSRLFFDNFLISDSMEVYETEGGYSYESRTGGASLQAIAKPKEPKLEREDTEAGECKVCLQEMSAMKELLALPCDHIFQKECILSWLEKKTTCPLCRFQLQD